MRDQELTISASNAMKGLSILGVLVLHLLTLFPYRTVEMVIGRDGFVMIDQLARFCVPLFVALSGYGLLQSDHKKSLSVLGFVQRRVLKLFPLFLLWSGVSIGVLGLSSVWNYPVSVAPWYVRLFIGQADYHLYFVPMIVQLYIFFLIVRKHIHRWWLPILILAGITQVLFYRAFSLSVLPKFDWIDFTRDQGQYILGVSWIWYFVLGLSMPRLLRYRSVLITGGAALAIVGFLIMVTDAQHALESGKNFIDILKFTKESTMLYATGMILLCMGTFLSKISLQSLVWLGSLSYLLYLSHPLLFRILIGIPLHGIPVTTILLSAGVWLTAWFISLRLMK